MALDDEPVVVSAALTMTFSGAASSSDGAVYLPSASTVPTVPSLPPRMPFTLHVTVVPAGVTENCSVSPKVTTAVPGDTVITVSSSPLTAQPDRRRSKRLVKRTILNLKSNALYFKLSRLLHKLFYSKQCLLPRLIKPHMPDTAEQQGFSMSRFYNKRQSPVRRNKK